MSIGVDNNGNKDKSISMQKVYDHEFEQRTNAENYCVREVEKAQAYRDGYKAGIAEMVNMLQHSNLDSKV